MESHYIPKTSQRKYIAPGLSISKMYDLFVEYSKEKDTTSTPVKSNIYRGRHVPANKTTDRKRSLVKEHIESFPLVESHYIPKTSQRKYIAPGLSISKMYDLFVEYSKEKDTTSTPVKSNIYREIFCNDYNSFHVPKNMKKDVSSVSSSSQNNLLVK